MTATVTTLYPHTHAVRQALLRYIENHKAQPTAKDLKEDLLGFVADFVSDLILMCAEENINVRKMFDEAIDGALEVLTKEVAQ